MPLASPHLNSLSAPSSSPKAERSGRPNHDVHRHNTHNHRVAHLTALGRPHCSQDEHLAPSLLGGKRIKATSIHPSRYWNADLSGGIWIAIVTVLIIVLNLGGPNCFDKVEFRLSLASMKPMNHMPNTLAQTNHGKSWKAMLAFAGHSATCIFWYIFWNIRIR